MSVQVREFYELCEIQQVMLSTELRQGIEVMGGPESDLLKAIFAAGRLLREQPHLRLADYPIAPSPWAEDTTVETLIAIVNASITPQFFTMTQHNFISPLGKVEDICDYADTGFANTLGWLGWAAYSDNIPMGCQLYMADDEPLLLRKSDGVPSALSLESLIINGIPYPAGSILRLDAVGDHRDQPAHLQWPSKVELRPLDDITNLSFQRLSAFALTTGERAKLFASTYEDDFLLPEGKEALEMIEPDALLLIACEATQASSLYTPNKLEWF